MKGIKEKQCLYCKGKLEGRSGLFCSAGCKNKYEERERKNYIKGIDKNWK